MLRKLPGHLWPQEDSGTGRRRVSTCVQTDKGLVGQQALWGYCFLPAGWPGRRLTLWPEPWFAFLLVEAKNTYSSGLLWWNLNLMSYAKLLAQCLIFKNSQMLNVQITTYCYERRLLLTPTRTKNPVRQGWAISSTRPLSSSTHIEFFMLGWTQGRLEGTFHPENKILWTVLRHGFKGFPFL